MPFTSTRGNPFHGEAPSMRVLKWIVIAVLGVHVPLATYSGYRAIVQVYSVRVRAPSEPLQSGSTVGFDVATSGRVPVDVELMLVQGSRAETLTVKLVRAHANPSYDPRTIRASSDVTLTGDQLGRFVAGRARLRAVANGRSQWLRTPPPVVREAEVEVAGAGERNKNLIIPKIK